MFVVHASVKVINPALQFVRIYNHHVAPSKKATSQQFIIKQRWNYSRTVNTVHVLFQRLILMLFVLVFVGHV